MSNVDNQLQKLLTSYIDSLTEKAASIEKQWQTIYTTGFANNTLEQQDSFYTAIHSLGGSGATFGFTELTNSARLVEGLFKQIKSTTSPNQNHLAQLDRLVSVLIELCHEIRQNPPLVNIQSQEILNKQNYQAVSNHIIILETDPLIAEGLNAQLLKNNYTATIINDNKTLDSVLSDYSPLAMLIDTDLLHFEINQSAIQSFRKNHGFFPILCTAATADLPGRLSALRHGADYFFKKPFDISAIVSVLNTLSHHEKSSPYRVMLVDDDAILANLYAHLLSNENVTVKILHDSSNILQQIEGFEPELILLDIHMGEIDGFETARLIRQISEFDFTSIIFMSSDQDTPRQLTAIDHVGDFLKKPIWPEHFVTTVLSKCRHARKLQLTQKILRDTLREHQAQKLAMDQHSIISITDKSGAITYINHMFCDISGYSEGELIGQNHRILKSGEHTESFYIDIWQTISRGKIWHGEIKNKSKNGSFYWVESTIVPFLDNNNSPYQYISVRTDITKIKNEESKQKERQQRLKTQNTSLAILTNKEKLYLEDKHTAFYKINEIVAQTLLIDRASIWFFDNKSGQLACSQVYNRLRPDNIDISALGTLSCPAFLGALSKERIIVAESPSTHPLTAEIEATHLKPNSTKSIMVASIYYESRCIGAIMCESCTAARIWHAEDQNFITTIADHIALLTEQWKKQAIQDQLILEKIKAEKANKAKTDFLSKMSHELRTPLNAIIGFSQLIELNPENMSESQQDSVHEILNAGRHLLILINDILDLSVIESGKTVINMEKLNLSPVIMESIKLVSPLAQNKSISIITTFPESREIICACDKNKIKQVIINLLSNAIKYNTHNGQILISCQATAEDIIISIEDTGYGISDNRKDSVFKPFERTDSDLHAIEGTGIGLAICKNLVELMGGSIGFSSQVGVGSKFWFNLAK